MIQQRLNEHKKLQYKGGRAMKIAVCDDDAAIRDDIVCLIKKQVPNVDIFTFVSGEEMINHGQDFDISFISIEMEKMTGIDTAKKIREEQERKGLSKSIIIFITECSDYMELAFDVNAYHYLLKPIDNEKFAEVLKRAWKDALITNEKNSQYIMVKSFGVQHKIFIKSIYYIESNNKKVIIHTKDGVIASYGRMDEWQNLLGDEFYRCHRCYLVNMENISAYSANMIQVSNGEQLILAKKKYKDFEKRYQIYAKNEGIIHI